MHSTPSSLQKTLLALLGIAALVVPVLLIVTKFNLVGLFYQPDSTLLPTPTPQVKSEEVGIALLTKEDFETRASVEVVLLLDGVSVPNTQGAVSLTSVELEELIAQETDVELQALFQNNPVILVGGDLVTLQEMSAKLASRGVGSAIYLINE
jgi:hypothetical protein